MVVLNDYIISGFKHFKALREAGNIWKVEIRKTKEPIGIIEHFQTGWLFRSLYQISPVHLSGEQLLDLAGLIKILSKERIPPVPLDPIADRIKLYTLIRNNWNKILDAGLLANGKRREGYRCPTTHHVYYVQFTNAEGIITDLQFFNQPSFLGKLSIKHLRAEYNYFIKLKEHGKHKKS